MLKNFLFNLIARLNARTEHYERLNLVHLIRVGDTDCTGEEYIRMCVDCVFNL